MIAGLISLLLMPQKTSGQSSSVGGLTYEELENQNTYLEADPEAAEIAYQNWLEEQYEKELIQKAKSLEGTRQGQCVVAVRKFLGIGRDEIQGLAKNTETNSSTPELGAIIKIKAGKTGHVGVVIGIEDDRIYIFESNWIAYEKASTRWLPINDSSIIGYKIIN